MKYIGCQNVDAQFFIQAHDRCQISSN